MERPLSVSIIVPVLNEAAMIESFVRNARERAAGVEIIVVDGGSTDGTRELAAGSCDHLIQTKPSRALQMNAGARAARGEILWFLHVDLRLPAQPLEEISRVMQDRRAVGGYFRIRLPKRKFVYRLTDEFAHYAGLLLRMRCGDHGLFCRRSDFIEVGGFPDVPIMEDVELFRALRRRGRMRVIPKRLIVSARRYEEIGPWRLTLAFGFIGALYFVRVPILDLAKIYSRTCCRMK